MEVESPSHPEHASSKAHRRHLRRQEKRQKEELKRGLPLKPRSAKQAQLIAALDSFPVVFALGPAGTGKTYVGARHALDRLVKGEIDKIVITRPTVAQAKHKLGYQPGGVNAKLRPWLIPVLDAFGDGLAGSQIDRFVTNGNIEFLGFEHVRGRTIRDGVFLIDEAQNFTLAELETVITRIGEDGQLIICGDPLQNDLDEESGLTALAAMVDRFDLDAAAITFTEDDVVRSKVAAEWVKAFAAIRAERDGGVNRTLRAVSG